ncbi:hemolysin III family protein [Reyranella aquatilis]|uniref:Hemolysin III family protein n=1 Tax=Reyranella aquatilis TaxID=2035356 RepID=A0ABS8L002_9HYPH|nr:hemolysin III family protein [Reyranella aquatilis]MCC8431677.1 hemolysin III family protein [Reyranella aquatilis]
MAEPTFDRPLRADAAVHALGLLLGIVGAVSMVIVAAQSPGQGRMAAVLVYVAGLLAMLGCSAAYNLRITSPRREWLRRLDHAAIFVMIAGTYTPLTLLKLREPWSSGLTAVMWSMAALGIAAKLLQPRRIESLSVLLYLLMGWIGVLAIDELLASVEPTTLLLLLAGGVVYSLGTIFHLSSRLPYQQALWHASVLLAASIHYAAILLLLTR